MEKASKRQGYLSMDRLALSGLLYDHRNGDIGIIFLLLAAAGIRIFLDFWRIYIKIETTNRRDLASSHE